MKGRGNYLCLHRFEEFRASAPLGTAAERAYLPILDDWAKRTDTGDRAEVEDLPDDLPFWNEIAATNENCLGTDCPRYDDCFVTRMRQRAAESDLVIVNHHLLCADAAVRQGAYGAVIPECHVAIIDEAHQLEDVATQYFGLSVSNYRLEELARDGERLIARKLVAPGDDNDDDLREALDRIRDKARQFFGHVATGCLPKAAGRGALTLAALGADERFRMTPRTIAPAADAGATLVGALDALEATIALLKDAPEDALAVARRAAEIRDDLRFLLRADDADYVFYLELRGRGVFLRAAPIDVSAIIRALVLDQMYATVLTSATLAVGGTFEYIRSRLGIGSAHELQLASEFDFRAQAVLYLPKSMPDPRAPGFVDAAARQIVEILRRTRGRAFVLFTSYANLRGVYALAERALEYPLLVQGSAPRSVLLRQFRATPNAVLLATSSFWQGVDVIGDALSCVIIDKLPFASPTDPITAARIEAIGQRGGEPFGDYQVPLAILTLQQGLGRLIRHRTDRGVLAILDPRLRTKGYGRRFLESLPPAPLTTELDDLARFLDG